MKRKILSALALMAMICAAFVPTATAQNAQNFTISSFSADYYLSRTNRNVSQMKVNEVIVADFPDYDQNHGLLRALPETYQGHTLSLQVKSVTGAVGQRLQYGTYEDNGNLVLKIGNPNTYVHGEQTYRITYTMQNVTANFASDDELYWNINGTDSSQAMNAVSVRLHLSNDLAAQFSGQLKCFAGSYGSTNSSDCTVSANGDNTLVTAAATRPLAGGETLTLVAGFRPHTFAKYHISPAHLALISALIAAPVMLTVAILFARWWRFGRDPKGQGAIVPEFLPPKEVSVLMSGTVLKEHMATAHISAQIIDLAVRHYVRIYQTDAAAPASPKGTHYELELVKALEDLRPEERTVADALFGADAAVGKRVSVDVLSHQLAAQAEKLRKTLPDLATKQGYFVKNPVTIIMIYAGIGIFLCLCGLWLLTHSVWLAIGVFASGLLCLVAAKLMPARSVAGVRLRDYLFGLKYYMKVAEAERIRLLQSPHGELAETVRMDPHDPAQLVKLYERLLPFAMLFGIEREWASQFAALYRTPPEWFVGNWAAFNAGYFAGSIGSFSTTSVSAFTAPRSSSSSGFGGGGFSGGGGGGGGVGGW